MDTGAIFKETGPRNLFHAGLESFSLAHCIMIVVSFGVGIGSYIMPYSLDKTIVVWVLVGLVLSRLGLMLCIGQLSLLQMGTAVHLAWLEHRIIGFSDCTNRVVTKSV